MRKKLVHRNSATNSVIRWINTSRCWHLDTWLYLNDSDCLVLLARTGNGQGEEIGSTAWALERDMFGLWHRGDEQRFWTPSKPVLLTDPVTRRAFGGAEQAALAFNHAIRPLGDLWPRGDYPRRSICHHMVKPVYVNDPCDGLANFYSETGRAVRDIEHMRRMRNSR